MIWVFASIAIAAGSFLLTCLIMDLIEFFGKQRRK